MYLMNAWFVIIFRSCTECEKNSNKNFLNLQGAVKGREGLTKQFKQ